MFTAISLFRCIVHKNDIKLKYNLKHTKKIWTAQSPLKARWSPKRGQSHGVYTRKAAGACGCAAEDHRFDLERCSPSVTPANEKKKKTKASICKGILRSGGVAQAIDRLVTGAGLT